MATQRKGAVIARAHSIRCTKAKTDPAKCQCSCVGKYHGTAASFILSWEPAHTGPGGAGTDVENTQSGPSGNTATRPHEPLEEILADEAAQRAAGLLTSLDQAPSDAMAEQITAILIDGVSKALDRRLDPNDGKRLATLFAGHFLCSLFAAFACLADEIQEEPPKAAATSLKDHRRGNRSSGEDLAIDIAVKVAWIEAMKLAQHIVIVSQLEHLLMPARVLAVITCPDADNHADVQRCCLKQLVLSALTGPIQELLSDRLT